MKKFTHGQIKWLQAGLEILGEQTVDAVIIDSLGKRLNLSKGSFYHHFKDREAFLSELIHFWESSMTDWVIDKTQIETGDQTKKLQRLAKLTSSVQARPIERAVRQWSLKNSKVKKAVERVEGKRRGYLEVLLSEAGIENPMLISRTIYAIFLGVQYLVPPVSHEELLQMYEQIIPLKKSDSD